MFTGNYRGKINFFLYDQQNTLKILSFRFWANLTLQEISPLLPCHKRYSLTKFFKGQLLNANFLFTGGKRKSK